MIEFFFKKNQLELLEELGKVMHIYVIFDKYGNYSPEVFMANEFRHGETNIPYHSMKNYRKITDIVAHNSTYVHSPNALAIITTQVDAMTIMLREKKFDYNAFYWIKF